MVKLLAQLGRGLQGYFACILLWPAELGSEPNSVELRQPIWRLGAELGSDPKSATARFGLTPGGRQGGLGWAFLLFIVKLLAQSGPVLEAFLAYFW